MSIDHSIKKLYANIGKLITSSLSLDSILEGIMEEVRKYFNPQNWSLLRLDITSNKLFFVIVEGIEKKAVEHIQLSLGEGIAGTVAQTKKSIFVSDTSQDTRFSDKIDRATGFITESIIAVPLIFRERVYGVIEIINSHNGNFFSADEALILGTIADFAAIAFANATMYKRAVILANTDPLTGLYNRFKLEKLITNWENPNDLHRRDYDQLEKIIAIVIDVDNFKEINDTFSHRTGDSVLREIASRLINGLRDNDLAFRIGGDEFLALIRVDNDCQTGLLTGRIEQKLQGTTFRKDNETNIVKLSTGISTGNIRKISEIIHQADLNMYEKKKTQKNPSPNN
ncbi:MAG: sensor domain-containing diguanylate cyclase [Spirochaetes bacterium]|nr:sensor domain-containing diguanylate cyclase [Spirochaetota bacterium]